MIWLGLSLVVKALAKEQDKTVMARWEQVDHGEVWAEGYRGPHTIAKHTVLDKS